MARAQGDAANNAVLKGRRPRRQDSLQIEIQKGIPGRRGRRRRRRRFIPHFRWWAVAAREAGPGLFPIGAAPDAVEAVAVVVLLLLQGPPLFPLLPDLILDPPLELRHFLPLVLQDVGPLLGEDHLAVPLNLEQSGRGFPALILGMAQGSVLPPDPLDPLQILPGIAQLSELRQLLVNVRPTLKKKKLF